MRTAYSLGSLLSIDEVLTCGRILAGKDVDTVWIPETWGMENFAMLAAVSQLTKSCKIGSSITNIYSRSPAAIAMGAVTVDTISGGRMVLGLGTSSIPIVEQFHGYKFERPLQRMREYVEIIRNMISTQKVDYAGKLFCLDGFSLLIKPPRNRIPIYMAAVNKKMVDLAWSMADGIIFYLRPIDEMKETISKMQAHHKIDVALQIITCVSEDQEVAVTRAKKTLAFYIAVGKTYREFLAENGFRTETGNIFGEFKESGLGSVHELVPDGMLESLAMAGTPEQCKKKMEMFRYAGVDLPIIQFNPVGNTAESFRLLTNTFSEDV